ncbi:MAG: TlpA family protein disulfide reductase [Chitinophagaceae bacterium]|nr:TlpA family protein disulfide reductase [Chitinophagaceae bacterium]
MRKQATYLTKMSPKMVMLALIMPITIWAAGQSITPVKAPELTAKYKQQQGVVVLNFWSTWCKPCIDEIPHFLATAQKWKDNGVELWLISQDTDELYENGKLLQYIKSKKWLGARHFWLSETNADYYCPIIDPKWSGTIPSTLVYNRQKNYYRFYETPLSPQALEAAIAAALQ